MVLGEKYIKLVHLKDLRDESDAIPPCAEKTIIELLVHFEQTLLGGCTPSQNEKSIVSSLQKLQGQLKREELSSETNRTILQNLNIAVQNKNSLSVPHILGELLKKIRPLNVKEVQRLVVKAQNAAESIHDRESILLIGTTGSGKSTTVQFLAGSRMKKTRVEIAPGKFIDHITVDGPITNDELINVTASSLSKSETRYIAPVTIQLSQVFGAHETGIITLCDAPGFEDTAGPEVNIANSVGVIEAIKSCKNIKLLVLSSYKSLGDKGQGIQKLAHILINMVDRIEDRFDAIIYAFTKYPEDMDINALLTDIKTSHVNADFALGSDTTFVAVLNDMIEKTEDRAYTIDPINGDRKILLKKLKNAQGIKHPEKVFRSSISKDTKVVIVEHVQRDRQSINNAMEHKDNSLVLYYLNDLKILQDFIQQSLVGDAYEKCKHFVSENISKYCTEVMKQFSRALTSQDGLNENDILDYKASVQYLEEAQILNEHLGSNLLSPTTLMQNIISELQKRTNTLNEGDVYSPLVKVYLDNLYMLKNSFKELENSYNSSCKEFEKRFEALVQSAREPISNNEFDDVAQIILKISKCLSVLKNHSGEQVEMKYKDTVKFLMQHLISYSEKVDYLLVKRQLSKSDIKILQQCMEILRSAKENFALQDRILTYIHMSKSKTDASVQHNVSQVTTESFKDLNEIYNNFFMKIRKYFDQINVRVKELFEKYQDDVLNEIQKLIDEMDTIRTIPELESKTTDIYYNIVDNLRGYMQQVQKNVEQLLDTIKKSSESTNYRHLARALLCIKNAKWINRVSATTYENLMYHITEDLIAYAQQLENRLMKLDLSLKCPGSVDEAYEIVQKIESMIVLEVSVPELKKYQISIVQHFLHSIQRVFSQIYETFNLQDKTVEQIKQHLKQLETDKRKYDRLHSAREHLQKHNYSDIDALNREIEDLQALNDVEIEAEDEEKHKTESQLNNLELVNQKYISLQGNNTEANDYLKDQKYSNINAVQEAICKARKTQEETLRLIENKRKKRHHFISQRESIKTEYQSLLSKDNVDLSGSMSLSRKVRDNNTEFIDKINQDKTTITSEREKIEQKYDSNDILDVSTANDVLIYISQCKKVNHHIVKDLAVHTDEKLQKYIREYGNFLNQEIDKNFKGTISNDKDEDLVKYAQDLERYLNELLSFSKSPHVSECIDGTKKVRSLLKDFTKYYRVLSIKMEQYKTSGNNAVLEKQLLIAKVLSFLDDFCTDASEKTKFGTLHEQYQGELTKGYRETYDTVEKHVSNGDYALAGIELSEIYKGSVVQKKLSLIACELRRSLDVLINKTKKILSELDGKFDRKEDNENQIGDIIKNIEKIRVVLKTKSVKELLDEETNSRLERCESATEKAISKIILKRLTYVEACLNDDNFYEAEQTMDNISRVKRELADHCISDSTIEKAQAIKKKLDNILEEISKRDDFDDIKTYSMHQPKVFLANLKKATEQNDAKYNRAYTFMSKKIHTIFKQAIEEAHHTPWNKRFTNVNSLNSALKFLPDELQIPLQLKINVLSQLTADEEATHKRELDEALKTAHENDTGITKLGELAQKYKTENIHVFFETLSERIVTRLRLYLANLERCFNYQYKRSSIAMVKKIFRYKEALGTYIQDIEKICNSVYHLTIRDFSKCSKTLANISSMGETQIAEEAFSNMIFYINLYYANAKKLEDILPKSVLQGGINGFQQMFAYLNENSKKYETAIAVMNVTELHKTMIIAKKWDHLLDKINQKRLGNDLIEILLENIPNVTQYVDMIVNLETKINHLKAQLNVELISDDTTKFEIERDKFFCNLMNGISTLKEIESKFSDVLSSKLDIEEIEEKLRKKVEMIGNQLINYASKRELSSRDSNYFRMYYNHLLSFGKYVLLSGVDVRYVLDVSEGKIFTTITNLLKQSTAPNTKVPEVAELLPM